MASNGGRGVNRVLAKLRTSIEAGNYYEAHQMYKTLYFRYTNQEKYAEVVDLLYDGAMKLSNHGQHQSAADLCMLLVETLKKSNDDADDAHMKKLGELFSVLRPDQVERQNFLSAALEWSSRKDNAYKSGHPTLHSLVAESLWKEKNYAQARYHFVHSHAGESCALMLVEYSSLRGFQSEVDLFITQAVLQYLCLSNIPSATLAFKIYTTNHPAISPHQPPFLMPLLNFVWFLLLTVETGKLAVFTILCEQYRSSIGRDPSYKKYLDRIGQLFFGLPPPSRAPSGGIFGNLMASMMGRGSAGMNNGTAGGDDEDSDDGMPLNFEDLFSSILGESRPSTSQSSAVRRSNPKPALKQDDDLD